MGSIVGGLASAVVGGVVGNKASKRQAKATRQATEASLAGFNFLKDNELVTGAQDQGQLAQGLISALLGLGGDETAANRAFDQFRDSTGFRFRTDRGLDAINTNRAVRGLLNSGGTLKALNTFGQGIASDEFSNFLSQLGAIQGTGLTSAFNVASQGATGGANAAQVGLAGAAAQNNITRQTFQDITGGLGQVEGAIAVNRLIDAVNGRPSTFASLIGF